MEDWADGILSTLEVNLDKFLGAVKRGRERLQGALAGARDGGRHGRAPAPAAEDENPFQGLSRRVAPRSGGARLTRCFDEGPAPPACGSGHGATRCRSGGQQEARHVDDLEAAIGGLERQLRNERDADPGRNQSLDGHVVVRAEDDVGLAASRRIAVSIPSIDLHWR